MKAILGCLLLPLTVAVTAIPANAKGCIKGAVVGGVAGHFAGHHGLVGAAAGCIIGHHEAKKREKAMQNAPDQVH
jgi:outer membrane lipoprotein SlyB